MFWESHDPTQGMRQGKMSAHSTAPPSTSATCSGGGRAVARAYRARLGAGIAARHDRDLPAPEFYFAEDYHQQYLHKNPHGYCGLGGTGVTCPTGTGVEADA